MERKGYLEMKPYIHSKNSAKKYGGVPEDYQAIHDFIDSTKAHVADMRHRAILHNSFGIYLAEKIFGTVITNSDNKKISVRDVAEDHVLEDLGTIPTLEKCLEGLPMSKLLGAQMRTVKHINMVD